MGDSPSATLSRELLPQALSLPSLAALMDSGAGDALASTWLLHAAIEFTSRCNLRCVYCAVSQPDYVGSDLAPEYAFAVVQDLAKLGMPTVALNGHGETLLRDDWVAFARNVLDAGFQVHITSNLSRHLQDEELGVLARFHTIRVSVDTADPGLLRRMRRRVDLGTILANILRIRARSRLLGTTPPRFAASCGIYAQNSRLLSELAHLFQEAGFVKVDFWNYVPYATVPTAENALPVSALSIAEQTEVLQSVLRAMEILHRAGIEVTAAGDLLDALASRIEAASCRSEAQPDVRRDSAP
ncbi:MAG: radical SAM protein [Planctomycetes bacterium]|nr:radical SAM protein [Planctomycetota bacterium]